MFSYKQYQLFAMGGDREISNRKKHSKCAHVTPAIYTLFSEWPQKVCTLCPHTCNIHFSQWVEMGTMANCKIIQNVFMQDTCHFRNMWNNTYCVVLYKAFKI